MQWLSDSVASMWGGGGTASAPQNAAAPAAEAAQQPLQEAGMLTKVLPGRGAITNIWHSRWSGSNAAAKTSH